MLFLLNSIDFDEISAQNWFYLMNFNIYRLLLQIFARLQSFLSGVQLG
jgi:hypothetical protein